MSNNKPIETNFVEEQEELKTPPKPKTWKEKAKDWLGEHKWTLIAGALGIGGTVGAGFGGYQIGKKAGQKYIPPTTNDYIEGVNEADYPEE